jgi:hypothetical protein
MKAWPASIVAEANLPSTLFTPLCTEPKWFRIGRRHTLCGGMKPCRRLFSCLDFAAVFTSFRRAAERSVAFAHRLRRSRPRRSVKETPTPARERRLASKTEADGTSFMTGRLNLSLATTAAFNRARTTAEGTYTRPERQGFPLLHACRSEGK